MPAISKSVSLIFAYLLIAVSFVAVVYAGWLLWEMYRPAQFEELNSVVVQAVLVQEQGLPVSVSFPEAGFSVPLQKGEIKDGKWKLSYDAAEFVDVPVASGSARIVYGHNYLRILGKLGHVKVGQRVEVGSDTGMVKTYKVTSKEVIEPNDIAKILPSQENELVIYTCTGFLDSKRLVIHAQLIK